MTFWSKLYYLGFAVGIALIGCVILEDYRRSEGGKALIGSIWIILFFIGISYLIAELKHWKK